jgi:tetratricopeptide (TPR) repeat protein
MKACICLLLACSVISGVCVSAEEPTKEKKPEVFRLKGLEMPTKGNFCTALLLRELQRQAFLIAARDGLGIQTRDEILGEDCAENPYKLEISLPQWHNCTLKLFQPGKAENIYAKDYKFEKLPIYDYFPYLEKIEEASRTEYIDALKSAGFSGIDLPKGEGKNPEWLLSYADSLEQSCLFLALRKLHEICRRDGESAEIICQLARSYADLGSTTTYYWNPMPKAFYARAMLYAQRGIRLYPESVEARQTMPYVLGMVGFQGAALKRLAQCKKDFPEAEIPSWLQQLESYCKYDYVALRQFDDLRGRYLYMLSGEFCLADKEQIASCEKVLEKLPDCYRAHIFSGGLGGVSHRHRSTVIGTEVLRGMLRSRLQKARVLPEKLNGLLDASVLGRGEIETKNRIGIINILYEAGKDDEKELTWSCLGRMLHEISFHLIKKRVEFMAHVWSVDVDDYLQENMPVIETHPMGNFLCAYLKKYKTADIEETRKLCDAIPTAYLENRLSPLLWWLRRNYPKTDYWGTANLADDVISYDSVYYLSIWKSKARHGFDLLRRADPHNPYLAIFALRYYPEKVKNFLPQWEKELGQLTEFNRRLGIYYQKYSPEKALAVFEKTYRQDPADYTGCYALAKEYKRLGKMQEWRQTLESYLQQDDNGLQHATIRCDIARYLMEQKKYQEALPIAERAAQTWAGWAMSHASNAAEFCGDFAKAELWIRREAERYDTDSWYLFCTRTGKGDLAAAKKNYEETFLPEKLTKKNFGRLLSNIAYYLMENQADKLEEYCRNAPAEDYLQLPIQLFLAEIALAGGKDPLPYWNKVPGLLKGNNKEYSAIIGPLCEMFRKDFTAAEPLDVPTAFALIGVGNEWRKRYSLYHLARFLELRGRKDEAIDLYQRFLPRDGDIPDDAYESLVWRRLRENGVDIYKAITAEKPAPLPEPKKADPGDVF